MFGAWALLVSAIAVEVGATAALPRTHGFRDPAGPSWCSAGTRSRSGCWRVVIRHIPVSVTYAVWSGLGTAGIAAVGVLLLGERLDLVKAAALC